jgi:hypothetical protein
LLLSSPEEPPQSSEDAATTPHRFRRTFLRSAR